MISAPEPLPRLTNLAFVNALLDTEITQRNGRKDSQENTARGVIVTAGLVLTLLLSLANDTGLFASSTSIVARLAIVATVVTGAGAAACAVGTLWPRKYDRLGEEALNKFNQNAFLDSPEDVVAGQILATRVGIAKTMDTHHESKAAWLKWSFRLLLAAFACLVIMGVTLAVDPPATEASTTSRILQHGYTTSCVINSSQSPIC